MANDASAAQLPTAPNSNGHAAELPKDEVPSVEHRDIEHTPTTATYIDSGVESALSPAHRDYLMKRHGTVDLDPMPGHGNADPYNWPQWKVHPKR